MLLFTKVPTANFNYIKSWKSAKEMFAQLPIHADKERCPLTHLEESSEMLPRDLAQFLGPQEEPKDKASLPGQGKCQEREPENQAGGFCPFFFLFNGTFYFEIIVNLHAVIRNNADTCCLAFTPVVTSWKNDATNPSQDMDNDAVKMQDSSITTRVPRGGLLESHLAPFRLNPWQLVIRSPLC